MIASVIAAIVTLGTLSTMLASRQMSDFSRKQLLVDTAMQGLAEQLKNRTTFELLPNQIAGTPVYPGTPACLSSMAAMTTFLAGGGSPISVAVELDNNPSNTLNNLILSPLPYIPPSSISPGAIPYDSDSNGFGDINGDGVDDVGVNTMYIDVRGTTGLNGSVADVTDDIRVNIMVWIIDYTAGTAAVTVPSRAIFINYTWTYKSGKITRKIIDSVRAIKTPL